LKLVGDDEVIDYGLQDLVDVARRRNQTDFLQMVYRVVFCHPFPQSLGFDGALVFRDWTIIYRVVNLNLGELFVVRDRIPKGASGP
jgi:hypothetical protein